MSGKRVGLKIQPKKDHARKNSDIDLGGHGRDQIASPGLQGGLPGFEEQASLQAQPALLSDPRFRIAQRQAIALSIGREYGNRHLQRLIGASVQLDPAVFRQEQEGEEPRVRTMREVHWDAMAEATKDTLEDIVGDIEDEAEGGAREIAPEVIGPLAERLHPALRNTGEILEHVNTAADWGQRGADAIELIENIRKFNEAMTNARRSGSGDNIREVGSTLADLTESMTSLLDYLPDELEYLVGPVTEMLRMAGRLGGVATTVLAAYVDRVNEVSYAGARQGEQGLDLHRMERLMASLSFYLGDDYKSQIAGGADAADAEEDAIDDIHDFIEELQDGVEDTNNPWFTDDRRSVALNVLHRLEENLNGIARRVSHDVIPYNQLRLLIKGAWSKFERVEYQDSMLVSLSPTGTANIEFITGRILDRGSIDNVCNPRDVGLASY